MRKKHNAKDLARILMADGEIVTTRPYLHTCYVIVKAYGHTYRIDNPTGDKPVITQMCQNGENV